MGSFFILFFFFFLGPLPQHVEIPRIGVQSELQLLAYTTATAMPYPSHVLYRHHSSQPCQILNPLSEARDRTHNLMVLGWIHFHCTATGIPKSPIFFYMKTFPDNFLIKSARVFSVTCNRILTNQHSSIFLISLP